MKHTPYAVTHAMMVRDEVYAAARWCKRNGLLGKRGDSLPELISGRAYTFINNNPRAFREIVRNISE